MNQPKDKPTFFEKYAVKPVKDKVSEWLGIIDNDIKRLNSMSPDEMAKELDQYKSKSMQYEPKKPKRKPAPTDKNYLAQQRGTNGRFGSKKAKEDIIVTEWLELVSKPLDSEDAANNVSTNKEVKELLEDKEVKLQEMIDKSFSKVAILTGNYVKSIDHSTEAKYTANDIREALIWGLNNHGGTMLPSKKAALYMRDRGIS